MLYEEDDELEYKYNNDDDEDNDDEDNDNANNDEENDDEDNDNDVKYLTRFQKRQQKISKLTTKDIFNCVHFGGTVNSQVLEKFAVLSISQKMHQHIFHSLNILKWTA